MRVSAMILASLAIISCSEKSVQFTEEDLTVVNRKIVDIDEEFNTIVLNNQLGDGLALVKNTTFDIGTIEIELKGENVQGKSFLGIAFNIENDSTYEAVYFRPFNFQSYKKIRREHSLQYIYHPKYTWRYLRTNNEGQFEAEFPRQPSPDDWFKVQVKVTAENVKVFDAETNLELLSVGRLTEQTSNKIALWTGHDSKGAFRNLKLKK